MKAFKIVEIDRGKIKTLFHGINGSRVLEPGKWYQAVEKMVNDNATPYLSGFHVLPDFDECVDYMEKFKNKENKIIVECECQKLRKKEHSPANVFLARKIKIIGIVLN